MAEIKMSQLISGANTNCWFKLYSMMGGQRGRDEVISKEPIGKINLESNFFENSSDDEVSASEDESLRNSEILFAKKMAEAGKAEGKEKIWNPGYIQKGEKDLDLIDDHKLMSKPYWLQQRNKFSGSQKQQSLSPSAGQNKTFQLIGQQYKQIYSAENNSKLKILHQNSSSLISSGNPKVK